jgi:hypothetical protein
VIEEAGLRSLLGKGFEEVRRPWRMGKPSARAPRRIEVSGGVVGEWAAVLRFGQEGN